MDGNGEVDPFVSFRDGRRRTEDELGHLVSRRLTPDEALLLTENRPDYGPEHAGVVDIVDRRVYRTDGDAVLQGYQADALMPDGSILSIPLSEPLPRPARGRLR